MRQEVPRLGSTLRNLDKVRPRLQWLTDDGARVRVAPPLGAEWCMESGGHLSSRTVIGYMNRAGMEDVRDWSELQQQGQGRTSPPRTSAGLNRHD